MNNLSDDLLLAFLAGDLDPTEHRLIADSANRNPELRKRLDQLQKHGIAISKHKTPSNAELENKDQVVFLRGPAPSHIDSAKMTRSSPQKKTRIRQSWKSLIQPANLGWANMAAMPVAMAIGFAAYSWLLQDQHAPSSYPKDLVLSHKGRILAGQDFFKALETTQDGTTTSLRTAQGYVIPLRTFTDEKKRYCREYDMAGSTGTLFSGIACREPNKKWTIRVHVPTGVANNASETFRPASTGRTELVELITEQMKVGPALESLEVKALLQSRWQKK